MGRPKPKLKEVPGLYVTAVKQAGALVGVKPKKKVKPIKMNVGKVDVRPGQLKKAGKAMMGMKPTPTPSEARQNMAVLNLQGHLGAKAKRSAGEAKDRLASKVKM